MVTVRRFLPTLLFLLLQFRLLAATEPTQTGDPDSQMAFADFLYVQGDYYRAITEYERFLFLHPGHESTSTAHLRIGLCYFLGEKWDAAREKFQKIESRYGSQPAGKQARLLLAETYYRKRDYSRAIPILETLERNNDCSPLAELARMKLGMAYLRIGNMPRAVNAIEGIPTNSPCRVNAEGLLEAIGNYEMVPRKSPAVAGCLSAILPGAGQLYIRRPSDAIVAVLLNGLLLWATTEAFERKENATGAVLAAAETSWYLGNIYNAVNGAHKFNRMQTDAFFNRLQFQFGVSLPQTDGVHGGVLAGVRLQF